MRARVSARGEGRAHAVSPDAIFDHAANKAVKALRKTRAGLKRGDRIIVSKDLLPAGTWVIGHAQ